MKKPILSNLYLVHEQPFPRRLHFTLISTGSKNSVYLFRRSACRDSGGARANSINKNGEKRRKTVKNGEAYRNIFISCHATAIYFRGAGVPFARDRIPISVRDQFAFHTSSSSLLERRRISLGESSRWKSTLFVKHQRVHTHAVSLELYNFPRTLKKKHP